MANNCLKSLIGCQKKIELSLIVMGIPPITALSQEIRKKPFNNFIAVEEVLDKKEKKFKKKGITLEPLAQAPMYVMNINSA